LALCILFIYVLLSFAVSCVYCLLANWTFFCMLKHSFRFWGDKIINVTHALTFLVQHKVQVWIITSDL
jgi:hypothetical protein